MYLVTYLWLDLRFDQAQNILSRRIKQNFLTKLKEKKLQAYSEHFSNVFSVYTLAVPHIAFYMRGQNQRGFSFFSMSVRCLFLFFLCVFDVCMKQCCPTISGILFRWAVLTTVPTAAFCFNFQLLIKTMILLSTASWGGEVEREMLNSSPWDPVIGYIGIVQSCTRGDLDWTLGSLS